MKTEVTASYSHQSQEWVFRVNLPDRNVVSALGSLGLEFSWMKSHSNNETSVGIADSKIRISEIGEIIYELTMEGGMS